MKNVLKYIVSASIFFMPLLSSCSNSTQTSAGSPPSLIVDSISPTPLVGSIKPAAKVINGNHISNLIFQPATYAVYIKNIGLSNVTGLNFGIENTKAGSGMTIDASNCKSITAGSSCRINITAAKPGNFEITGSNLTTNKIVNALSTVNNGGNGSKVVAFVTSVYPLIINTNENKANALTLLQSPNTLVLEKANIFDNNYYGAMSISVVNNYNSPINVTNLFKNLPNHVSWSMISCPNPLPSGGVCEVRLTYNGYIDKDITVNLYPSGKIFGSEVDLPTQNSSSTIVITKNLIANLNISAPSLTLSGNTPNINNSTTGYITNTGTKSATISNITINNNIFSISNNQCIGQLPPKGICQYTITSDVSKLANIASGYYSNIITVNYNTGSNAAQAAGLLNYGYTAIIPPANLSIALGGVTSLDNNTTTGNLTVTNTSNVALSSISMPILSGSPAGLAITDPNKCETQTLNPQTGCSFVITLTPNVYSESSIATVSGINASYTDPINQIESSVFFSNSYAINITTAAPLLIIFNPDSINPDFNWTNSTSYLQNITMTNNGSLTATNIDMLVASTGINSTLTVNPNGCDGLAVESSCMIKVSGNYSNSQSTSYASNAIIIATATDNIGNTTSQAININANVQMMPVVTPGLGISGVLPNSIYSGESGAQTILLTLTNYTSATNNGNTAITIDISSLTNNIGANLTGSLNTTGIETNACNITGTQITLDNSCNVNLVLTAHGSGITTATIAPTYKYYSYNSASSTPVLISASGSQLSTLSRGCITINEYNASLNLAFYTDNSDSTPITSISTEVGIETTAVLQITNTGTTALAGITMPTVSGFTFTPDSSCASLAAGASCNVSVALYSTTALASTNLNSNSISYTYTNDLGSQTGTTNLPSLSYQVTAPASPSISASTSFINCSSNVTDTTQQCNLNPTAASVGGAGSTGVYEFVVTYSNTGSGSANITVIPAMIGNYLMAANNCNTVELTANTGNCTVEYLLSSPDVVGSGNIPSAVQLGTYKYTYGSNNQISVTNQTVVNPNPANLNITEPFLALSLSSSPITPLSYTATATTSSWYALNAPSNVTFVVSLGGGRIMASETVACTISGSGCTSAYTLPELMPGTNYFITATITAPDGTIITTQQIEFTTAAVGK